MSGDATDWDSSAILLQQAIDHVLDQLRIGNQPDVEQLARQFPKVALQIRQLVPSLVASNSCQPITLGSDSTDRPTQTVKTVEFEGNSELSLTVDAKSPTSQSMQIDQRYQLLKVIGEGGMGSVWLAEQNQPVRRLVAIKLIKAGMDSRAVLARFDAERQALAMMDHPNIARVYDGGMTEQLRPYFAMEYVNGTPLTDYCDQQKLSITQRLELMVVICRAVQHAHQKGIMHRDLKPSNVLVSVIDGRPVPKVIDFGLAKAIHQPLIGEALHTALGTVVGTPLYMSPEQAESDNWNIDTRTDIYSLGVILYELLTGTTPLDRKMVAAAPYQEILRLIKEVEPTRPSLRVRDAGEKLVDLASARQVEPQQLPRELRGDLDWVVMKALAKEPARRYETANSLARDIERYLAHELVEAAPPTFSYRMRKAVRRNRRGILVAAALLSLLLTGTAVSIWQAFQAEKARAQAEEARGQAADREQEALDAQREASLKAAEAQEISGFLLGMFEDADLLGLSGRRFGVLPLQNPPILTIVDRGAKRLTKDGPLGQRPQLRASLLDKIGNVYLFLGDTKRAEPLLKESLQLRKTETGNDPNLELSESHYSLGMLAIGQMQFAEAERNFRAAYEIRSQLLGSDHVDTVRAREFLGVTLICTANGAEGTRLLEEVSEYYRRRLQEARQNSTELVSMAARDLGVALIMLAAARAIHDNATGVADLGVEFAALERDVGHDQLFELGRRYLQTRVAISIGQHRIAKQSMLSLRAEAEARLGEDHFALILFSKDHMHILYELGEFEEGERAGRQNMELIARLVGPENPMMGGASYELARHLQLGRLAAAKRERNEQAITELSTEVLQLAENAVRLTSKFGERTSLSTHEFYLAFVLHRVVEPPQLDRAIEHLQKCCEIRKQLVGQQDALTLIAEARLIQCLAQRQRADEAIQVLRGSAASTTVSWPPETASDLSRAAEALCAMNRLDESLEVLQQLARSKILRSSLLESEGLKPMRTLKGFEELKATR